jgi:hypothetical protein
MASPVDAINKNCDVFARFRSYKRNRSTVPAVSTILSAGTRGTCFPYEIWSYHGGEDVDVGLLGGNAVWTCKVADLVLKTEAVCSSETLVSAFKSTRVTTQKINIDFVLFSASTRPACCWTETNTKWGDRFSSVGSHIFELADLHFVRFLFWSKVYLW